MNFRHCASLSNVYSSLFAIHTGYRRATRRIGLEREASIDLSALGSSGSGTRRYRRAHPLDLPRLEVLNLVSLEFNFHCTNVDHIVSMR